MKINYIKKTITFDVNDFDTYAENRYSKKIIQLNNRHSVEALKTLRDTLNIMFSFENETVNSLKGYTLVTEVDGKALYIKEIHEMLRT